MPLTKVPKSGAVRGYVLYLPDNYTANKKYPVYLFFHGMGQMGDGSDLGMQNIIDLFTNQWYQWFSQMKKHEAIWIAVQIPWGGHWKISDVDDAIDIANTYSIDPVQKHLTGLSLGGEVVWGYPSSTPERGKMFASITPVCAVGGTQGGTPCNIKSPVYAFHAENDPTVGVVNTKAAVAAINACPTPPPQPAKMKILPSGGHDIWGLVYGSDEYYDWTLAQKAGTVTTTTPTPTTTTRTLIGTYKVWSNGDVEKV